MMQFFSIFFWSTILCVSFCKTQPSKVRDKRNSEFACGASKQFTGYISGGDEIKHGTFPW
jgi:hypothetical protein